MSSRSERAEEAASAARDVLDKIGETNDVLVQIETNTAAELLSQIEEHTDESKQIASDAKEVQVTVLAQIAENTSASLEEARKSTELFEQISIDVGTVRTAISVGVGVVITFVVLWSFSILYYILFVMPPARG